MPEGDTVWNTARVLEKALARENLPCKAFGVAQDVLKELEHDSPQVLVRHHSGDEFRDMIIAQFEELLRQSARQPLVCGIALHTMIVGQPYRLRALREALAVIAARRDEVWITTAGGIYDHCLTWPEGSIP